MADETVFKFIYQDGGGSASPSSSAAPRPAGGASRPIGGDPAQPAGRTYATPAGAASGGAHTRPGPTDGDRFIRTLAGMPFFGAAISLLSDMAVHLRTILGVMAAGSRVAAAGAASGGARVVSSSVSGAAGGAAGRAALPPPSASTTALTRFGGIGRAAGGAIGAAGGAAAGGAIVGLSATGVGLAVAAGLAVNLMAMKAATRQLDKFADSLKRVDEGLLIQAQRLSPYNAQLATAQARAEISRTMGDIRQAQQLGPQLSRYQDARTSASMSEQRIQTQFEKLKLEFMTPLAEIQSVLKGSIANILEEVAPIVTTNIQIQKAVFAKLLDYFPELKESLRKVKEWAEKENNKLPETFGDPIMDAIFLGGGFHGFNQGGALRPRAMAGHLNEAGVVPFRPVPINGGDLGGI